MHQTQCDIDNEHLTIGRVESRRNATRGGAEAAPETTPRSAPRDHRPAHISQISNPLIGKAVCIIAWKLKLGCMTCRFHMLFLQSGIQARPTLSITKPKTAFTSHLTTSITMEWPHWNVFVLQILALVRKARQAIDSSSATPTTSVAHVEPPRGFLVFSKA